MEILSLRNKKDVSYLYYKNGPARIFSKIGIGVTHVSLYGKHISQMQLTTDKITVDSNSNPKADFLLNLMNILRYYDAKSGKAIIRRTLGGTIGQLTYYNGEQLCVPNESIDLFDFNILRKTELEKNYTKIVNDSLFTIEERQYFKTQFQNYCTIPLNQEMILETHLKIEHCLYSIQCLPNFNKAISFINVINNVGDTNPITVEEIAFIKAMVPNIHPSLFSNPRNLRKFLQKALEIYATEVDRTAIKALEKTKKSCWVPCFLDDIDITLFL